MRNSRCKTCYGYGLWDDGFPLCYSEALQDIESEACPECGADNIYCTYEAGDSAEEIKTQHSLSLKDLPIAQDVYSN